MATSGGQEKTEQPTQKKLEDGRKKGQVAKSVEINSLAVYTSGLLMLYFSVDVLGGNMSFLTKKLFSSLDYFLRDSSGAAAMLKDDFINVLLVLCLIFGGIFIAALVANISQVGFHLSPEALQPKFSRFNPAKGIKRILFSSHSVAEVIKSILKLIVIGTAIYIILNDIIFNSVIFLEFSLNDIVDYMRASVFQLTWKTALVFTVIAALDFMFQKRKFKKEMMMTKQEIKEEIKQSEGDPLVKSRIRKIQHQLSRNRFISEVPKADVIITNPTHYAIAIKYDSKKDSAPRVLAKGVDEAAVRIKEIAAKHQIQLYEDRELARALYRHCNPGDIIPESLFRSVAQVLAYVYQLKNNKTYLS
jgi:flagellar biosynthesis protein FlhB